ncbi:MAG: ATP-dependent Lhr-like helicase, partial [Gammaproteobacteria bacterium]
MSEHTENAQDDDGLAHFHPAVRDWFTSSFGAPTQCQSEAWAAIALGRHALVAAPTGSGKTLAAFLGALDDLVREGLERPLTDTTRVLYVSPLKALSNDIQRNLERPLMGISDCLNERGLPSVGIRTMVRTGDTPQSARSAMRRTPPHILVTTPESLYILLTSDSGRRMLGDVRTVIVDEIHALASSKRGAHMMLCLERLDALTALPAIRIGLSATQKPINDVARFLVGTKNLDAASQPDCTIVDTGHMRERDLALELPPSPLEGVMSGEVWAEVYERLLSLIAEHHTTLIFVNTRRLAERIAHALTERLGTEHVTSHHGSLAREQRLDAEQRLKRGDLKALVATASLELGIDIGDVDLVCQIGSPRSIATFLQRVGRSGHAVGGTPKGRLFPLSRDDLVECAALLDAVARQELDRLIFPHMPLDVLSQQIVAMCAAEDWDEEALWLCVRGAWPFRDLDRDTFTACLRMLADGYATRRGRRSAYLHRDAVNQRLHARRGARLTAITNGGAIPNNADFDVVLEPEGTFIGTLNEDFAIESMPGDIFLLGNYSWRILRVESGKVRVADAHGQPPNIPFWFGEAPGRTDELSAAVARLRSDLREQIEKAQAEEPNAQPGAARDRVLRWLQDERSFHAPVAEQLLDYLGAALAVLGELPDHDTVVLERFFDESGGMQLVVHSCFGSRINKAWGLALRKRFCRAFNFELQAAANEDSIILSLGETHSFPLADTARFLSSASVRDVLIQALLDAPVFDVRWRWNANISLAVP